MPPVGSPSDPKRSPLVRLPAVTAPPRGGRSRPFPRIERPKPDVIARVVFDDDEIATLIGRFGPHEGEPERRLHRPRPRHEEPQLPKVVISPGVAHHLAVDEPSPRDDVAPRKPSLGATVGRWAVRWLKRVSVKRPS